MNDKIVSSFRGITLVGGGELGIDALNLALLRAPDVVAVDGGAGPLLSMGHMPLAVIGDFDSVSQEDQARVPADRLFLIREQHSTDFEKALVRISAPIVLGVGFLGARVDHQLAAFNTLVRHAHRPCILIGENEVIFHAPPHLNLDLAAGAVVSLFPMSPVSGRSKGLEWPIDGLELAPDGRVGTSNRALGPIEIDMDQDGLLVILPRSALDDVMRAIAPGQR